MNLGMPEMIFIFLLALVVVGPKKLPELARQLGKWYAEFKRASNDFKNQLESEVMTMELEERAKKPDPRPEVLPAEKPWEPMILPPEHRVSRGNSGENPEILGLQDGLMMPLAPQIEEKVIPVKSAGPDA